MNPATKIRHGQWSVSYGRVLWISLWQTETLRTITKHHKYKQGMSKMLSISPSERTSIVLSFTRLSISPSERTSIVLSFTRLSISQSERTSIVLSFTRLGGCFSSHIFPHKTPDNFFFYETWYCRPTTNLSRDINFRSCQPHYLPYLTRLSFC